MRSNVCACACVLVCVCFRDMNNVACALAGRLFGRFYVNAVCVFLSLSLLLMSLPHFLLSLCTIFASNCTRDTEALLSVRPRLCLAGEWTHSALWCKHATSTYSSLAAWGWDFSYVCVFLCYLFFYKYFSCADVSRASLLHLMSALEMEQSGTSATGLDLVDWFFLYASQWRSCAEALGFPLMLHPQRFAKMCEGQLTFFTPFATLHWTG